MDLGFQVVGLGLGVAGVGDWDGRFHWSPGVAVWLVVEVRRHGSVAGRSGSDGGRAGDHRQGEDVDGIRKGRWGRLEEGSTTITAGRASGGGGGREV